MIVRLDDVQMAYADRIAARRFEDSRARRLGNLDGLDDGSRDRAGSRGEIAAVVCLGMWPPTPALHAQLIALGKFERTDRKNLSRDVGPYHVRTARAPNRNLIVREGDPDDLRLLAVRELEPNGREFEIQGEIVVREVRDERKLITTRTRRDRFQLVSPLVLRNHWSDQ